MDDPAPRVDGRRARRERSRDAVIDAVFALIQDGKVPPDAEQVADRSGVSVSSISAYERHQRVSDTSWWARRSALHGPPANRSALVAMSISKAYAEIAVHRAAGLAGQLNIETTGLFVPA